MYCPNCGQQQASDVTRFCSRCGFPLEGVLQLITTGGMMPVYQSEPMRREPSPRAKGVRQGGMLLLLGAILVPMLGILNSYTGLPPEVFVALAALICFAGGFLRMLFAAIFEEGAPHQPFVPQGQYQPAALPRPGEQPPTGLPPAGIKTATGWRRPNTAELANQPSVTENTTRLLVDHADQHKSE